MLKFKLNPITRKKLERFRSNRRGFYSLIIFSILSLLAVFAELWVSNRALIVSYEGEWYFPTYTDQKSGAEFGEDYTFEANYRDLAKKWKEEGSDNWVLLPLVPYGPNESDFQEGKFPPFEPSFADRHYLGTDKTARDVLARLVYGFRIVLGFSVGYVSLVYLIGVGIGCSMGYFGGKFDLLGQRLIEIWSNIPFLYVVIIVASVTTPSFWKLLLIVVAFSWTGMTFYMRSGAYKEKARDYVAAAEALGAGNGRIIFKHVLPNSLSTLVTFIPFTVAAAITSLTALDFLNFGLPVPTPSWGELLKQGTTNLHAPWIVLSAFGAMVLVLLLVTFIGEAIREAFDPKKFTLYQ
ncbi:ABC transporter permease [Pelagicoccus mobilis]|uniref:ABC transporter permease n=1 Tax=Pelagicoccus mobilis TaxID=415221 RepID=A0A934S004_9BACT|nr:ABC transporter permease [Pelagicoccus mobilis]MBK1878474.1 ABC transporter permease [Pelagicoccus mobilis]